MLSRVAAYGVALAAVAAAVLLRWLLDPVLGDGLPLVTLFGAVAAAVWVGGYRPALLSALLGYLACDYLFIEPRGRFVLSDPWVIAGLIAYLVTCAIIIGFCEAMRTARRRSEVGRETLRVTLASMGDAVITTDGEGLVASLNAVAESLTGWAQEDSVGKPLEAVFRILNEQTREPVENPVSKVLAQGQIVGLANHTILIRRDGSEVPIDDSAAPIRDAANEIRGIVLVFRDIRDRRKAEEVRRQYAAIVESSEDAILGKDLDGIISSWNAAAERLYGYTAEEATGKHISMLLLPDPPDELPRIMARLQQGERIHHHETVRVHKDGRRIDVSLSISPVRNEAGRIIGASAIARDITERKQLETARRELMEQLRAADARKDEFLAILAHELRNPLAPVRNAVQILKMKGPPVPELEWARDVIDRQMQQMARLLDDLMDVSRVSRGMVELRKEPVELARVVQAAVETSRPLVEQCGHELSVELPQRVLHVDADMVRLAQVFSNLLNNAAKYTERGGRITLAAVEDGSDVVVSVKDTGIGIPPDQLRAIFEMFFQVRSGKDRSQGGLGIGLSLVKRLVEMHGGTIEARSEGPKRGSELVIRLPLLVGLAPAPAPQKAERQPLLSSLRILIVDDNQDVADSLALMFRILGNESRTANDGEECVRAAEEFRPDVVLLDIGLPKLNGYAACRRIREQPWGKATVIIAVTGWGQEEDRQRAKEAGFDRHMVKPVDPEELMKLLPGLGALKP